MKDQDGNRTMRRRLRHTAVALAAIAAAAVGHGAARAETEGPGAGTQFRNCSNQAFADYNDCLMEDDGWIHRKFCDLVFQADVVWCGSVFKRQITTGQN